MIWIVNFFFDRLTFILNKGLYLLYEKNYWCHGIGMYQIEETKIQVFFLCFQLFIVLVCVCIQVSFISLFFFKNGSNYLTFVIKPLRVELIIEDDILTFIL